MKFRFSIIVVLVSLFSCTDKPGPEVTGTNIRKQEVMPVRKPPSSFSDTLIIKVSAAVFYNPDSTQLAKMKTIITPNELETEQHTSFYLMRNARKVLKTYWPKIRIIETSRARYLLFIKENKEEELIDLDKQGDLSGIFLFDKKKHPELADMMNIDTALGFYFEH